MDIQILHLTVLQTNFNTLMQWFSSRGLQKDLKLLQLKQNKKNGKNKQID